MSTRFPGRRLSFVRLSLLSAVVAAVAIGGLSGFNRWEDARVAESTGAFFAGYVDVTATPSYAFEDPAVKTGGSVVLSFIVAAKTDPCEPSWGTYYGLDEAEAALDLDRRVARMAQNGGEVIVSFGGLLNDELATSCTDPEDLADAYADVIDRYELSTVDLDIEGENLRDTAAGKRRAEAMATLQAERADSDTPLNVWLTLPVAPTGMTAEGTAAVAQFLEAGVDLAGVNVMTMDYGASRPEGTDMLTASQNAADATHRQLQVLYQRAGIEIGPQAAWRKIGLTPMIGQNDVKGEVFTLDDAKAFNTFATERGAGRMSLWSLNRDGTCSENYADTTVVSDACSGIDQQGLLFAPLLGEGFDGRAATLSDEPVVEETPEALVEDDPKTSPYPIWSDVGTYREDDRVVWQGNVYVAKYWTQGDLPNDPVLQAEETPWTLLGPVLPNERPVPAVTAPAGLYPVWDAKAVYERGDRILVDGKVFEAKWWSQSDSPEAAVQGSDASPWQKLDDAAVLKIVEQESEEG
ncbi:glycosyl hydrolase family 18 [Arthrobacter agilis]|uniref:chitinase n=1 Tax=Arthrobacter agilis TaxID=37921 RepID=UPI000B350C11|nr:carbohydrate-binding protein [Arthrobacter agilis]OUM43569.1 glycosyl hydrolase family 18 [Arthrobacter agilis]PPB47643.1 glycosyl hydrolase family 18 [Arthrobacter agilis]TPV24816.1 glycosyl hydrolase family 18 [Arthrobacter agilis]VDR30959.1 Probable bifunctional chitinase/lysozyme precursor [Arthrobacter agilis]